MGRKCDCNFQTPGLLSKFLVESDPDSPEAEASLKDRMREAHRAEGKQCTPDLLTMAAVSRACLTVLPAVVL